MSYDLYAEAEMIAMDLDEDGFGTYGSKIRDAIHGGSTGSEILMALTFLANKLLHDSSLSPCIRERLNQLELEASKALSIGM